MQPVNECECVIEHVVTIKKLLEHYAASLKIIEGDCTRLHRYGAVSPLVVSQEMHHHIVALQEITSNLAAQLRSKPAGAISTLQLIARDAIQASQSKLTSLTYRDLQLEAEKSIFHIYGLSFNHHIYDVCGSNS